MVLWCFKLLVVSLQSFSKKEPLPHVHVLSVTAAERRFALPEGTR